MEKEPNQSDPQIKEYGRDQLNEGDVVRHEGRLHRVVRHDTGYTLREYFSHSTPEKGPRPGWDSRRRILEQFGVDNPSDLPDESYTTLELEPIGDKQ